MVAQRLRRDIAGPQTQHLPVMAAGAPQLLRLSSSLKTESVLRQPLRPLGSPLLRAGLVRLWPRGSRFSHIESGPNNRVGVDAVITKDIIQCTRLAEAGH